MITFSLDNSGFSEKEIPVAPGYIFGIRSWMPITPFIGRFAMRGKWLGEWNPGINTATCSNEWEGVPHHTEVPYDLCKCGFWAYWEPHLDLMSIMPISGIIKGYGKTIIGTKGFRCEKAEIMGLVFHSWYKDRAAIKGITEHYNVPIFSSVHDILDLYPINAEYKE